jgi:hypothetical protein
MTDYTVTVAYARPLSVAACRYFPATFSAAGCA